MTLYGGLEHKLNMALFGNKKYKTESDKLDNPGRRNFLETSAKGALAIGLAGTGFLKPETAFAYNAKDLPPGFWPEVCKDEELRTIFGWMYTGGSVTGNSINKYNRTDIKGKLIDINPNTPLTEPAYWFTLCYYNYKWQDQGDNEIFNMNKAVTNIRENIEKNNPPMYNWSLGVGNYFTTWVAEKKTGTPLKTEIYLLKAIFTAAGRNESVINDYRILDFPNKERFLQGVMKDLEKQNRTNQLIAAWSSFFLADNYYRIEQKGPNTMLIYNQVEQQTKKIIGTPIRGPPHYKL